MKTLLFIFLLTTPAFVFGADPFSITYPNIKADLEEVLSASKMGPAGAKAPLDIHPPPGGIEGIYPVYGNIFPPSDFLQFRWSGKEIIGAKPALILFEVNKQDQPKIFFVKKGAHRLSLNGKELGSKPGKEYHWYLGKIESEKAIAQSRVFSFRVLTGQETTNLKKGLSKLGSDKDFLAAQIYYNYGMYHEMIHVLESLKKKNKSRSIEQLLFLGYIRLGRHSEAKRYETKN